ncbi:MAG: hypothetical protein JRG92_19280 [Deltaproteobacteria bacterium]|nr:hypothetical protein [Deltaproteobacteria bacterium]
MSVQFPRPEFFEALRQRVADDPDCMGSVDDCEAYCGFVIGERLIVVEFDGRQCVAVVNGGNLLDLDFALAGTPETWQEMISAILKHGGADREHTLETLIETNGLEIRSEAPDGTELARAALSFLQAFLDQAKHLEVQFE